MEVESKIERERKRDREMKAMKNKASTEVVDIPPIYKLVASENKQIYMWLYCKFALANKAFVPPSKLILTVSKLF